ncbi:MAG: glycosyltransferase family 2 protein, partial [Proteobacteria bacterium]|nr:glycosyltransferase family 2 protein [Pseudomonadota bacterium]
MTRMTEPAVTVVIPAYNAAWCIRRAVDSVLAQTFRDVELIVVDDGSTDDTAVILRSYGNALHLVSQANGGMSSARNAGIRAARGRYVAFLDSDDRWLPDKLARQVALMTAQPDLAFCAATATLEDPEGKVVGAWACSGNGDASVADVFASHATIAGGASSVLARRELVQALGGFDETLFGAE